jgi:hypothetical protein
MRKILFLYLFTIIFETSLIGANKFALIIAAWDYERLETKWGNLSSANDVNMIRDALVARGFMESNIVILKQDVTKENIINAFNNSLLDKASKGDIIFFHYSGHGYQIPDNNNDELDELNESLDPYKVISLVSEDSERMGKILSDAGSIDKIAEKKTCEHYIYVHEGVLKI